MEEVKKKPKIGTIILDVISLIVVALVIYLVVEIIIGFAQGKPPCIFNHYIFVVQTKSMDPTIKVGDVVFVSRNSFESVKEGDIITFLNINPSDPICGQYVTHRANQILSDVGEIVTLGDNNHGVVDAINVSRTNYLGTVDCISPFIGSVISVFTSQYSIIFILIIVALLFIVGFEVKNIINLKIKANEEKEKEKIKKEILEEIERKDK